jgi:hypothetical protein
MGDDLLGIRLLAADLTRSGRAPPSPRRTAAVAAAVLPEAACNRRDSVSKSFRRRRNPLRLDQHRLGAQVIGAHEQRPGLLTQALEGPRLPS